MMNGVADPTAQESWQCRIHDSASAGPEGLGSMGSQRWVSGSRQDWTTQSTSPSSGARRVTCPSVSSMS